MGKQHSSSNDKPGRRPAGRPTTDRNDRPERGSYGKRDAAGSRSNTSSYGGRSDRPNQGERPERGRSEGFSAARPAFGRGEGKPGGAGSNSRPGGYSGGDTKRRSFSSERASGSDNRRSFSGERAGSGDNRRSFGGSERPSGGGGLREGRSERPASGPRGGQGERPSYGAPREDRPRNQEGERSATSGEERPKKSLWQGQPVRYEGKPTVPRGQSGERNRKFIKKDPTAPADDTASARPAYQGRDERRAWEERGTDKPTGAKPYQGNRDATGPTRSSYGSREGGYDKRDGDSRDRNQSQRGERDDRRPTGNSYGRDGERPGGYERRPASDQDGERRESGYGKPRSTGERPSAGGSGTFRERRDAMRDQVRGGRTSGTSYGRGEGTGQAPDYKNLKHYEDDKNRGNKRRRDEEDFGTEEMRLNRYIANAGICSRREADSLIASGEIRVNGEVVTEMGYKVQPSDTVQYGKTNLNREKLVYVLLNKPKDFITTTDDPEGRKTVMDLVANASKERIFPVGRLDRNTTGLLLFTNDGEVAQKLSHPSHKNKKIYQVELSKPLSAEHLRDISAGVELEDGKAEVDDVAVVAGNPHFVGVELHIGRNRIVRRIFEHLGYEVVALDRVQYAGITKKELPRGKWRFLSEQEVIRLKYFM